MRIFHLEETCNAFTIFAIVSLAASFKDSNLKEIASAEGITPGPMFLSLRKDVIDSKSCLNSFEIFDLLNLQLTKWGSF